MTGTLFTDVMIFDGSGTALFPGEVLVHGERIEAVAKGDERLPRRGSDKRLNMLRWDLGESTGQTPEKIARRLPQTCPICVPTH